MKKILLIALLFVPMICLSQPRKVYRELVGYEGTSPLKVKFIDLAGDGKINMKDLVDKDGNQIKIEYISDAMNYLSKYGWKLENQSTWFDGGVKFYWVISKEVNNDTEIKEGITTKDDLKNKK